MAKKLKVELEVDNTEAKKKVKEAVEKDPAQLEEVGVNNPDVLANSLHRMWGRD